MAAKRLHIVITFHQPLTASDTDLSNACDNCYEPLLEAIEAKTGLKVTLHFGGHVLDFLSRRRQEMLRRIRRLVEAGRIEILGGLFYGAVPSLIPEADLRGQLQMTAEYWESVVGQTPAGFWMPELAWGPEVVRFAADSELSYGFVSSSQIFKAAKGIPPLANVERAGSSIPVFVLNAGLSSALPGTEVEEWHHLLSESGAAQSASVWVRAESLGLEPGTRSWVWQEGWLERWLVSVSMEYGDVETALPAESFGLERPVPTVRLRSGIPPELGPLGRHPGGIDWADFPRQFKELDTLYRRMLRASDKLHWSIAAMEEEGADELWGDRLATAQRLIFAAQSPDVYWRSLLPGFSDPRLRDAVSTRLIEAEAMLDALIQGEDDWIATEEEDRDLDLVDEVVVANRHLCAWIVPAHGGTIRALDDRGAKMSLLDAGNRREEPFYADLDNAPGPEQAPELVVPPRRGAGLRRLIGDLPVRVDEIERGGIREWLLEPDAALSEFASGAFGPPRAGVAELLRNEIDEDGDASFLFQARVPLSLPGIRPRDALLHKDITVPIDAAQLSLNYRVNLSEGSALLAVEIPLRLSASGLELEVNGQAAELRETEWPEASSLVARGGAGRRLTLDLEPAVDVWLVPLRSTVCDLAGYRAVEQGALIVPVLRVEGEAELRVNLRLFGE